MLRNIDCHEIKTRGVTWRASWSCVKSLVEKNLIIFLENLKNFEILKILKIVILDFLDYVTELSWNSYATGRPGPAVSGPVVLNSLKTSFGRGSPGHVFYFRQRNTRENYALEWFSKAESAPIRSAMKFYFDIDVRKCFSTYSKNFSSTEKKNFFKLKKRNPDIKIEAKFHCGSNGSTLSL